MKNSCSRGLRNRRPVPMRMYIYIYLYLYLSIYIYIYIGVCRCIYRHQYIYIYIYVYIYISMYIYIYLYIYIICIYIHAYTYTHDIWYFTLIVMIVKLRKVDKLWSFARKIVFSGTDTVSFRSPAPSAKLGLTEYGAQDEMQDSWSEGRGLVRGRGLSTCNLHC